MILEENFKAEIYLKNPPYSDYNNRSGWYEYCAFIMSDFY